MKLYDEQYHQKLKENEQYEQLDAKFRSRLVEPKLLADPVFRKKKLEMIKGEKNRDFPDICDEVYFVKLFSVSVVIAEKFEIRKNKR